MNVYAQIIIDEAQRRGIGIEVLDPETNLFRLALGDDAVTCHESLTDRTPATTFCICQDKRLTHKLLDRAGFRVPRQLDLGRAGTPGLAAAAGFLDECGSVVVKPAVGEQGQGITVDVAAAADLEAALAYAREYDDDIILEEFVPGRDLRLIVIDGEFVAAIERRPAAVVGDGVHTIRYLVAARNETRAELTAGESQTPLDAETDRVLRCAGVGWDTVLPAGYELPVRKTANYHTGGTITDVTAQVSPPVRAAAAAASVALAIPVVGFDFLVPRLDAEEYVVIEANERPGLANHEPQPVVERFVDFLFPSTRAEPVGAGARLGRLGT